MLEAQDCHFRADDLLRHGKYSDAQIRSAFKFRVGLIYNMKLAHRYSNLPGTPHCPLCGFPDSGTHIMLACKHSTMHALYIARHNQAVRILANAMLQGQYAASFHTVDGGLLTRLHTQPHQHVANRTPAFLTTSPGAVERRPDILQVTGISWSQALRYHARTVPILPPSGQSSPRIINLCEVGYGVDTLLQPKAAEKRRQHATLEQDLVGRGWDVHVHGIALGVSGAIQKTLPDTLRALGISGKAVHSVLSKLQENAVRYCNAIHVQRRSLEHELGIRIFSGGAYTGHGPPGPRGGS